MSMYICLITKNTYGLDPVAFPDRIEELDKLCKFNFCFNCGICFSRWINCDVISLFFKILFL